LGDLPETPAISTQLQSISTKGPLTHNAQHLHSPYSASACQDEFGFGGTHLLSRPKGIGCQPCFSELDARASLLAGRKGRRWNLLKASFNLILFDFSFISVTQTPMTALLFQLI
jgi:hypothetical protein